MTTIAATAHRPSRSTTASLRSGGVVLVLVLLVAVISVAQPTFLEFDNLANVLSQWAPVAVMGIGMTYVVITGGFDLSIGSTYSLTAVVAASLGRTQPPLFAFAAAVLVGLLVGTLNGGVVAALRVNPFIATLGSSLVISGVTLVVTNNAAFVVSYPPFATLGTGDFYGIPYAGLLTIALMVTAGVMLHSTAYGQSVYAVGGNEEASRLAGIRTRLVVASTYALSGLCAGVAGVITASQLSSAQPNLSPNVVFDVLTVVIVGGTLLGGGSGAIWRTAVGVCILATLQNGFNLLDINAYYQNIVKGLIIVAAVSRIDWSGLAALRTRIRTRRPTPTDNTSSHHPVNTTKEQS